MPRFLDGSSLDLLVQIHITIPPLPNPNLSLLTEDIRRSDHDDLGLLRQRLEVIVQGQVVEHELRYVDCEEAAATGKTRQSATALQAKYTRTTEHRRDEDVIDLLSMLPQSKW